MKLTVNEKKTFSDTIDKLNEGLDTVIKLYNESEGDKPVIEFDDELIELIQNAKETYGENEITGRINKFLKEVLTFFPKGD